jgi:RNA polymerase sigma-70 factor, ECF subfamily
MSGDPLTEQRRTDDVRDNYTAHSDAALVMAIARFNQGALAEAYRRHAGAVFGLAKRLLGQQQVAEEVVQEVFLRLWNHSERFDPERGSLRSFLLAHAHGRAVDMLRSDVARRRREERDFRQAATGGYDVDHEVWDMTVSEQVRTAVGRLPETERKAIELAYFGGKTYREVARDLGEPEGTIKGRIRAGLKHLRSELVQSGVEMGGGA